MRTKQLPSVFVVGMALFSMFFGSGNLIFPLFLGQLAGTSWLAATAGFLTTAVLLPFLGVLIMVYFQGSYQKCFEILGKRSGFLFALLLLTVWIPLGSGPRCIALSYASLASYLPMPSIWVFSAVYCVAVYFVVRNRQRMIQILGKYLTPALLLCLGAIIVQGSIGQLPVESIASSSGMMMNGVLEGYNTMDLIAAFFFSASIIQVYCPKGEDTSSRLRFVLKAGMIGVTLLAAVYVGLVYLAAVHSMSLAAVPKEQLLAVLAKITLGPQLGIIAAVAIVLACFTTSVALTSVYADFISQRILKVERRLPSSVWFTLLASFAMSLMGLTGITAVTAPVLNVCYPLLLGIIVIHGAMHFRPRSAHPQPQ
ncbi:MAG: branched-chain amino acid transport system II carrier protein [Chlamydiia bacterium]|nr:branched-chain amino acid transport system II carrier protein [Chlamydiia bacterium]